MYLVSVYFDNNTNKILQKLIDQIAKETGNTFMTDHKVPPHMTIMAIEARNVEILKPGFLSLKGKIKKGSIQFVSVGQILPYVMYMAPVFNVYLQDIIKTVYDVYKDVEETSISKFYKPGSWLPHVTLGKTLDKEQMVKAFEVLQKNFSVFEAEIVEIGLAKVNPHEDVERFVL